MARDQVEYDWYWRSLSQGAESGYGRDRVLRGLVPSPSHGTLLSVGSGDSFADIVFQESGFSVTRLDVSRVALLRQIVAINMPSVQGRAEELPFKDESFSAAFLGDVLEHVFEPDRCVREASRVLQAGGDLIVSVPNSGSALSRMYTFLFGHPLSIEISGNPPWRWQHIRFYNERIMRELLTVCGLETLSVTGDSPGKREPLGRGRIVLWNLLTNLVAFLWRLSGKKGLWASDILVVHARKPIRST